MYSKNDYRYYLENQLVHSDDFLAHYGIKGMKWKQHKKAGYNDRLNDPKLNGLGRADGRIANRYLLSRLSGKKPYITPKEDRIKAKNNTKKRNEIEKGRSKERAIAAKKAKNDIKWHKKNSYTDELSGTTQTVTINGEVVKRKETYGKLEKRADMKADRKQLHKKINKENQYDKNKSVGQNLETAKKRAKLKRSANRRVKNYYD